MNGQIAKVKNLLVAPNAYERVRSLIEIRLNSVWYTAKPGTGARVCTFDWFRGILHSQNHPLAAHLEPGSDSHTAVEAVRLKFKDIARSQALPFSETFNADLTLALLSHAAVRCRHPRFVLESGVGYGITSALVLQALEAQGSGRLLSFDLSSLSDVGGACTGLAVPENLRHRWSLERNVSSRKFLPKLVSSMEHPVDVFISDSANVTTLQRFELSTVWSKLAPRGLLLFNNTSAAFQKFLGGLRGAHVWNIWQLEKPGCVTTLIEKD